MADAPRLGDWMLTISGVQFYPNDPRPEDVRSEDIAWSLSRMCRFGGHVTCEHYSVAEHSMLVASILPPHLRLQGLLHDATEAYCQDLIRPVKRTVGFAYTVVEAGIWRAIAARYGLPEELDLLVTQADNAVLLAEREQIVSRLGPEWSVPGEPARVSCRCLRARDVYPEFMSMLAALT